MSGIMPLGDIRDSSPALLKLPPHVGEVSFFFFFFLRSSESPRKKLQHQLLARKKKKNLLNGPQ